MSDPVTITQTDSGFSIHVDRGAATGFAHILMAAKYQPGLRWDLLLTPWIQTILEGLRLESSVLPSISDLQARVETVIDAYLATHQDPTPRDELIRRALYPIPPL